MDTNTIIILTAIFCFISIFVVFFIVLIRKGRINATKGYVFRHKFSGTKMYINPTDLFYTTRNLIQNAENDGADIEGIEIRLITKHNENAR